MNIKTVINYLNQHKYAEAESLLETAYQIDSGNSAVIANLILSLVHQQKFKAAQKIVVEVIENQQFAIDFCMNFALMFLELKQTQCAVNCFEKILINAPDNSDVIYNLAFSYNKNNQPNRALKYYQKLLFFPIDFLDDVHLNIANILAHQQANSEAIIQYQYALSISPDNQSALFNLASLYEQINQKSQAKKHFEKLLLINPLHVESMVRLIYMEKVENRNNPCLSQLKTCLDSGALNEFDQEIVHYGLGKANDDLHQYDKAFSHYHAANELGKNRMPEIVVSDFGKKFNTHKVSIGLLPEPGLSAKQAEPIFICGMYRSGSTLVEKVLSSHSDVDAGREYDFFKAYQDELTQLTEFNQEQQKHKLIELREKYYQLINSPNRYIIDKSPTNLKYLELIRLMFPEAKIIITQRNALDCCLSMYFQMFSEDLPFANDLETIFDEYVHCDELTNNILKVCDGIYTQQYEDLVTDQLTQTQMILKHCDLEWQPLCLNFHANDSQVNTASIWQVRQPIYKTSVGRWRNYATHIQPIVDLLANYTRLL